MYDQIGLKVKDMHASARSYTAALAPHGLIAGPSGDSYAGFGSKYYGAFLIDLDGKARRVAWSAVGGRLSHHNASMQIFPDEDGTKAVWIADLLPNELAGAISGMIEQGLAAMKKTLQR